MNGLSEIHYAESVAHERARRAGQRASEDLLLAGVTADRGARARVGRGLIKVGKWLAPQPVEPTRRPSTSPNC
jgi:hypothetical protein